MRQIIARLSRTVWTGFLNKSFPGRFTNLVCTLLLSISVLSCARTYLKSVEFNPEKGAYEEVSYSRHFEGESWIIPNQLRVFAYADIDPKIIPEVADPDNKWETVDFKIYFSNQGHRNIGILVTDILFLNHYFSDKYLTQPTQLVVVPNTVERIDVKSRKIDRYDKRFRLMIHYVLGGQKQSKEIEMRRYTVKEFDAVKPNLFDL